MTRPRAALAVAIVVVVAIGVAPAGAGTQSPKVWAKGLCQSISKWDTALDAHVAEALAAAPADATAAKAVYVRMLGSVEKRTRALAKKTARGATPDVRGGRAVVANLVDTFETAAGAVHDARVQVRDTPDDPTALAGAVTNAETTLQSALTAATLAFSEHVAGGSALRKAVASQKACRGLVGQ